MTTVAADGRPDERRRVVRAGVVALAATMFGLSVLLSFARTDADPERLVYVSGRDDHGLLASPTVTVHARPDGGEVGELPDGTIVRVLDTRGTWLHVAPVDGSTGGWVDDFWLRGRLHLVDPSAPGCAVPTSAAPDGPPAFQLPPSRQVELLDASVVQGELWVAVRPDEDHDPSWVRAGLVSELPGPDPRGTPDQACESLPWPEPVHEH
jgi:hypothetical protein